MGTGVTESRVIWELGLLGAENNWELGLIGAEITESRVKWEMGLAGRWGFWMLRITGICKLIGAGVTGS